ncbi:GIY-YIG nuclease family protein [Lactiplantibacillus plajomi]|uniref:GIY-YIG nuclease family protein n=1 Tax=Lactiplantibacillus plajomi TaxID=1457217 RepID=A0ABV6JZL6_9LACO|nr:GIY-YIG nuclease family protein [Lactiplantibacillus plajomi]
MKNVYGYTYRITNQINGKIYIGKKESPVFVKTYFGSGKLIQRAIKKYGLENFTIDVLGYYQTLEALNQAEIDAIAKYQSNFQYGHGYNIASGGDGGDLLRNDPVGKARVRAKMRINNAGMGNPNYGNHTAIAGAKNPMKRPENQAKLRNCNSGVGNGMYGKTGANYGKHMSVAAREKDCRANSGKNNANYGKHMSNNAKRHLSKVFTGRVMSDRAKQRM